MTFTDGEEPPAQAPAAGTHGAFWKQMEMSPTQRAVAWVALGVTATGLCLWNTLDDEDAARSDRTSKRPIAQVRRRLRRVLR